MKNQKVKSYSGDFPFSSEKGLVHEYSGAARISFLHDLETDETSNVDIVLSDVNAFHMFKEEWITTIRHYMLAEIKELIEEEAVQYAIDHDLTDQC